MKKPVAGFMAIAAVFLIGAVFLFSHKSSAPIQGSEVSEPTRSVEIGDTQLYVTIADSEAEREKGLSGRTGLAPDEGMLFIFERDGQYAFWMKDMKFAIDILWLDKGGKIVHIEPSLSPDTYPNSYEPKVDARYVLEVSAGFSKAHNIQVGELVNI